jgi:hypothetical protein
MLLNPDNHDAGMTHPSSSLKKFLACRQHGSGVKDCADLPKRLSETWDAHHRTINLSVEAPSYAGDGQEAAPAHHSLGTADCLPCCKAVLFSSSLSGLLCLDMDALNGRES